MDLLDIVRRVPPAPWVEGGKIPWDEPAFSARMLAEHLSQQHDGASRRAAIIDQQVEWIHRVALAGRPSRILDLGCGPGLYTSRLARLGHECTGIDFSPASVEHARRVAAEDGSRCSYRLADIRAGDNGEGFDLVMLIFGEFNAFRPAEARAILGGARRALSAGGTLLLEPHTFAAVQRIGQSPPAWRSAERGLFSDRPHLRLEESAWDGDQHVATRRYVILDAETGESTIYAESIQAYTDGEYQSLLNDHGFALRGRYAALAGSTEATTSDFLVLLASAI